MRRNTDPSGEVNSPLGWRKVLLSTEVDRLRYQKLSGLGWINAETVSQPFGSELHGHVADDVSKARPYDRRRAGNVSSKAGWGKQGGGEAE